MAAELEKLAREFQKRGYPSFSDKLNQLAKRAREDGLDQLSEEDTLFEVSHSVSLLTPLTGAMVRYSREYPDETTLSETFAFALNTEIGGILTDELPLEKLRIPPSFGVVDAVTSNNIPEINQQLLKEYRRILNILATTGQRNGFHTLQDLREASLDQLQGIRGIGEISARFLSQTFAKVDFTEIEDRLEKQKRTE